MLMRNYQANVYNQDNELILQTLGEFYIRASTVEIILLKNKLPKNIRFEIVNLKNQKIVKDRKLNN